MISKITFWGAGLAPLFLLALPWIPIKQKTAKVPVAAPVAVSVTEAAPVATEPAPTAEAAPAPAAADAARMPAGPEPVPATAENLDRGRRVYMNTCIRCHNKDPNVKGSIGPEMVDAPLEIMYAKVMTGRYPEVLPPGFVPKRKTKTMTKLPQHEKDVPYLHAWVQSMKKAK